MIEEVLFLTAAFGVILIILLKFFVLKPDNKWKNEILKKLSKLNLKADSSDLMVLSAVIIEADKLLDHSLKKSGVKGETLGEKLKNSEKLFEYSQYNRIWAAHKLRNRIAHETGSVSAEDLKKAYRELKSAIEKLTR
ncbi:hypothetical protein A2982_01925 [candidate division WWE3 bacterium RIFCSPLOWO2_01_FULL_39_13]|uniref:DUF4145 domain-containing protein n=1 Tax=candidate division WWE3 bacterium RIFCSPLOWO2_01_FULL_39_13 TaxID=1802624 RepID=A0A1F4V535_UNCKA|nr:MAG: hypothetical protein A2982_01925 [candidate division WWE3 bacterium RIFCSPLOWO2_01_FULL_39_13]